MRKKLLLLTAVLGLALAVPARSVIGRPVPYCWYCPTTTGACLCPPNTELAGKMTTCAAYYYECWTLIPP